ncbi:unnamed protein product [Schistocephalus solidus]|uniref:BACK domain-containing protein n=1 Tax=Schistocephalus solidus TaxID=70667 RepID=A0A183THF0_SCHSO|nr:unnamed protein product [Schistocephalus solidus]
MELLVQYAYTGQIEISSCNAAPVLITAGLLGLEDICGFCSEFIVRRLSKDSVFSTLSFALVFQVPVVIEGCMAFMLANFRLLVHSPLLARLDHETLRSLLRSDDLQVTREEDAFGAVSTDLLDQVIDWFLRPETVDTQSSPFNFTPRRCWQQDLICIFGCVATESDTQVAALSSLQIYDPNSGALSPLFATVHRTDCLILPLQGKNSPSLLTGLTGTIPDFPVHA